MKTTNYITDWDKSKFPGLLTLKRLGLVRHGQWLAGGALRCKWSGEAVSDYDLFFQSATHALGAERDLENLGATNVFTCPAGQLTTWMLDGMKIQVVKMQWYEDMLDVISQFDYTHACHITDGHRLLTSRRAIRDAKDKRLRINSMEYPVSTLNRLVKFARRGYKTSPELLAECVELIAGEGFEEMWPEERRIMYVD